MESLDILGLKGKITKQEQNHCWSPTNANQSLPVSENNQAPGQDHREQCYILYLQRAVGVVPPQNLPPLWGQWSGGGAGVSIPAGLKWARSPVVVPIA